MSAIETTETWIDRQPWPADVRAEARTMVAARPAMLNPLTRGQWVTWARARGLELAR